LAEAGARPQIEAAAPEAKIAADAKLPPIRVEGDVIETRVVDPRIAFERLRADELEVRADRYEYECVPLTVDPMGAEMRAGPSPSDLEPGDEEKWRLKMTFGALEVTGLVVAAGAIWWAARASGLIAGLVAALPAWRHVDPLGAFGRDEKKKSKDE
jgi:hypothetical protein